MRPALLALALLLLALAPSLAARVSDSLLGGDDSVTAAAQLLQAGGGDDGQLFGIEHPTGPLTLLGGDDDAFPEFNDPDDPEDDLDSVKRCAHARGQACRRYI